MEYVFGFFAVLVLLMIMVGVHYILHEIACNDCPRRKECEKSVRDNGITLCQNSEHLYINIYHQNHFML